MLLQQVENLISQERAAHRQRVAEAIADYRRLILEKADAPDPGDAARLREVLGILKLTTGDLFEDLRAKKKLRDCQQRIDALEFESQTCRESLRDAERALEVANRECAGKRDTTPSDRAHHRISDVQDEANALTVLAERLQAESNTVKMSAPRLWSDRPATCFPIYA